MQNFYDWSVVSDHNPRFGTVHPKYGARHNTAGEEGRALLVSFGAWILSFSFSFSLSIQQLHPTCRSCGSSVVPCQASDCRTLGTSSPVPCGFNTARIMSYSGESCARNRRCGRDGARRHAARRRRRFSLPPPPPSFRIAIHPLLLRDASSSPGRPRSGMSNAFRGRRFDGFIFQRLPVHLIFLRDQNWFSPWRWRFEVLLIAHLVGKLYRVFILILDKSLDSEI